MDVELSLSKVNTAIKEFEKEHFTDAFIGFLLVMSTFLFIIAILIDRPINRMVRTIRSIEKGDLSARMNFKSKDELGLLANSFNNMVEALESAKQEIELTHEHQMERAAKLATIGEIVAGIAHEVKNPLTTIQLSAQRLKKRYGHKVAQYDGQVFEECTNLIINQVEELKRLVNEFSSFARMPASNPTPNDVNKIIQESIGLYKEAQANVKITFNDSTEVPVFKVDKAGFCGITADHP